MIADRAKAMMAITGGEIPELEVRGAFSGEWRNLPERRISFHFYTERDDEFLDFGSFCMKCGGRPLVEGALDFYPWHLLDCIDPEIDWGGYRDPVAEMWCPRPIPESFTVSDEHLCGLGGIIRRIAADTGIRFTTYLYYDCIGPDGAAGIEPAIYETPIRNDRYR